MWIPLLIGAVWLTDWGADRIVRPFSKLRRTFGITGVAGAALIAIVTASPEVATNTVAAATGVGDIGLGNMLGANIVSIPLLLTTGFLASRHAARRSRRGAGERARDDAEGQADSRALMLERGTVGTLVWPYIGIVGLAGLLTLPPGWRGLQPVDGWIMLGAYVVFLAQALFRGKRKGERERWTGKEIALAAAGAAAVVAGAYVTVKATEGIVGGVGISAVVGGIFITGTMSVLPEAIKAWHLTLAGEATGGTTSVIPDNAVTITCGFLPLALVGTPIDDFRLYWVNLLFVGLFPLAFVVFMRRGEDGHGLNWREVLAIDLLYVVYAVIMLVWVLDVI